MLSISSLFLKQTGPTPPRRLVHRTELIVRPTLLSQSPKFSCGLAFSAVSSFGRIRPCALRANARPNLLPTWSNRDQKEIEFVAPLARFFA